MGETTATCPVCQRQIIIENGRWTIHSNPSAGKGRFIPRCEMAGRPAPTPKTLAGR